VGEKGAVPIKVIIQPAGYHEKVTLELQSTDFVADLRAEVAKWWETIQVREYKQKLWQIHMYSVSD
jgi:ubiquitin carboxyl-terminal hydrolase 34